MTKAALVCLVFLTKIDDVCDKSVFTGLYRWLDPTLKTHVDTAVLSFVLVIENAITATMKRQITLNNERFYDVVTQYHQEVIATKNEKLLILWLSILCKLTNHVESCTSMHGYLYAYLDGLLREYYYNEPVFDKLYNLMTNLLIGCPTSPADDVNGLITLSFHKFSVGTGSENFFMLYINFIEKLLGKTERADVISVLDEMKTNIVESMHTVPLLLRHISENIQKRFELVFPRKVTPLPVAPYFKTSLDQAAVNYLHMGSACKRYRPNAVIEVGNLFMDRQLKHLVFQKTSSLSVMPRDIIFLGDIIKVVKGHDDRGSFAEAIKKYNLSRLS